MSRAKIIMLVVYAVLALLALTQGGSAVGDWSLWILLGLAAVHLIEVAVFFGFCRNAGGSLPVHLVNVFFFGILHVNEVKAAQATG
ncbi:MAG: hypothetical protein NXI15_06105 [Gammaproteobacteria bacterium]|nr:hypothetical protein [Gammaproteobacteria bacterium]